MDRGYAKMVGVMGTDRPEKPARGRIPLRKSLGQHHLRRGALCKPLVEYLQPRGRLVVEIGPGGGVLTTELLAAGARVVAVEVDPAWGLVLAESPSLRRALVVIADALKLSWSRLPAGTRVTGNLPFNIATALIGRLLENRASIARMGFLLQREVADRLVAGPGSSAYGALSVLTAATCEVEILGRVARGSFRPPPKVEGSFLGLVPRAPAVPDSEMAAFTAMVRLAFSHRRKQLRNTLAAGWGRAEADRVILGAGLDPRSRAQELSLGEFVTLHRLHRERPTPTPVGNR